MAFDLTKLRLHVNPDAGDTNVINRVDSSNCYTTTGGTNPSKTNIDAGGGKRAWRYTGDGTSPATYTSTLSVGLQFAPALNSDADPGVVFGIRARAHVAGTLGPDFRSIFQLGGFAANGDGMLVNYNKSGNSLQPGVDVVATSAVATTLDTFKTVICRITPSSVSGTRKLDVWYEGGGGTNAPDLTATGGMSLGTLDELWKTVIDAQLDVAVEFVLRPVALASDADCRAAATDIYAALTAAGPTVSSPSGVATGNTTATVGFTTDQAVSGALPAYFLTLPAATAAPADAATLIANGATVSQTTGGTTPTRALTGLTTNTAVRTHMCQPGSNVVSSASYTPPTMASSGSLAAQSGTASTTFAWAGATPESQITVQGVGSSAWALTSAGGSGLSTINSSTGVPGGTLTATPGVYTVTVTKTDSSTAGTNPTGGGAPPQTIVRTATLTVSAAPGGPTINTHPSNQTAKIGATATFSASATASSGSLTAQWQKDAANISGANGTTSYARTGVVLADHGSAFRCGYSDAAGGPVYTNAATLTVAVTFINGPVPAQSGAVGVAASWDFSSYFAGGLSRTFAILSGALPAGMSQVGSTAVFSGTPSAASSGSMVVRATDSATNTDQTGTISWTISAALATTATFLLTTDGTIPAANLSGLKFAFHDEATPDLWTAPKLKGANGSTNGSGVMTLNITGVTGLAPGQIGSVVATNSDGTPGQGAALRFTFKCLAVS